MWKYTRERHGAVRTSELVDQLVSVHGWASAFTDEHFRWRDGSSAEENLQELQKREHATHRGPGSCFAAFLQLTWKTRARLGSDHHEWENCRTIHYREATGRNPRSRTALERARVASDQSAQQE